MSRPIIWRKVKASLAARPKGNPPVPAADDKPISPDQPPPEPPDPWKVIQGWVWKRFGVVGLVILAAIGLLWTQWDHVKQLPWIESLVARINEKPLPEAEPDKFNVAIAHLEGDDDHAMERVIRDSLHDKFPTVHTVSFDRVISSGEDERMGHERARTLLKASGFDVLIWGDYLKQDGKSLPRLHLTVSRDVTKEWPSAGRYPPTGDLNLPPLFWQDLTDVIGLVIATSDADFGAHRGQYEADKLNPFIQRVRRLLANSQSEQWNTATRAKVQVILGNALRMYGAQTGRSDALQEAVVAYREALKERPREKVPQEWAAAQNSLGMALSSLGELESDPARLQEAVAAYREALKERTREKVPLSWAKTQGNLGNALAALGERESDPAQLEEASRAYQAALPIFRAAKTEYYAQETEKRLQRVQQRIRGFNSSGAPSEARE